MQHVTPKRIAAGIAVAIASFVLLGTVAALWDNPFFVRMTPAGGWEIAMLGAMSAISGVYVAAVGALLIGWFTIREYLLIRRQSEPVPAE